MHANVALDISSEARADRGQWLLEWATGADGEEGWKRVKRKWWWWGVACWVSSCRAGGLRQRGKIEKGMAKDGEVYRDRERGRET